MLRPKGGDAAGSWNVLEEEHTGRGNSQCESPRHSQGRETSEGTGELCRTPRTPQPISHFSPPADSSDRWVFESLFIEPRPWHSLFVSAAGVLFGVVTFQQHLRPALTGPTGLCSRLSLQGPRPRCSPQTRAGPAVPGAHCLTPDAWESAPRPLPAGDPPTVLTGMRARGPLHPGRPGRGRESPDSPFSPEVEVMGAGGCQGS